MKICFHGQGWDGAKPIVWGFKLSLLYYFITGESRLSYYLIVAIPNFIHLVDGRSLDFVTHTNGHGGRTYFISGYRV